MRATTVGAAEPGDDVVLVGRTCRIRATWRGGDRVDVGADVYVELAVPDVVDWNDVALSDLPPDVPTGPAGTVPVVGEVVALDPDGVLTVRVDGTSLLMVEVVGDAPAHLEGRYVLLHVREVEAYPVHY